MLEIEPDFKNQKTLIEQAVEAAGGKVLFGTKFHPELMTIENVYRLGDVFIFSAQLYGTFRDVASYMKKRNVVGSSAGFVERVCDSFDSVDVQNVRKIILLLLYNNC